MRIINQTLNPDISKAMRIRISKQNDEILDRIKSLYKFNSEGIVPRIAFAYSLQMNKKFDLNLDIVPSSDGRDFRDDRGLFGTIIDGHPNFPIFKAILEQHYQKSLFEEDFSKLFKLHLDHGLNKIDKELVNKDITKGEHVSYLMKLIKNGLDLQSGVFTSTSQVELKFQVTDYSDPLSFFIGKSADGINIEIKINDIREFDNRNIAIAGMAGSGKTQLIKDILYQLSKNTENKLKYIFFDYKGEGDSTQLKPFLESTNCEFVDILQDGFKFNPLTSINLHEGERQKTFSIRAFADTMAMFVPNMGVIQKNILQTVLTELTDNTENRYPNINELFTSVKDYYESTNIRPDTLYAAIKDLASGLFSNEKSDNIISRSIYLNLPPSLSDTLRQLCVFLLLRYFNFFFSSTNEVTPTDNIIPLRYVIVIDEAHIYLKNKNARKALEELLRLLRSKGVIVVMLTQGVEDYKTKDFDFVSQVKLPICLNVQNKDPKLIKAFVGTPRSEHKLISEINKLQSGFGLINLDEPKTIEIRQFWQTIKNEM
jgi:DNA sulfur modification protein DndE